MGAAAHLPTSLLTREALPSALPIPWPGGLRAQPLGPQGLLRQNGLTQRIQPERQAKLLEHSQKPVSGKGVSQRAGQGGERIQALPSVQTLHLEGGCRGDPFPERTPAVSFCLPHSFIQSSARVFSITDLRWVLGIHRIKGLTVEGKRMTQKGRSKLQQRNE